MESVRRKTKGEIIKETFAYYDTNPKERRSVEQSTCKYNSHDGRKCAFSRCCIEGVNLKEGKSVRHAGVSDLDTILKPEYRGHSKTFWTALQTMHDTPTNWSEDGSTLAGRSFRQALLHIFEADD